jgi:hypothetical protein
MKKFAYLIMLLGWMVLPLAATRVLAADIPALADNVVVGVNVYNEVYLSQPDQDAEIERLVQSGVKTIRTGLGWNTIYFITQAYRHGIGVDAIVYPGIDGKAKPKGNGAGVPLSEVDPQVFAKWLKIQLDRMDAAGVRLSAIELGNEINTARFNGDIPIPGSGRVLGLSDLNNPKDPETAPIVAGYRRYLEVAAVAKDLRDHSKLNKTTPILIGLGDWGSPGPKAWNNSLGVSSSDTIEFMRQNGVDKLVDAYGVHVYPSGDTHMPVPARISQLEKNIFAACRQGTKPCWLTEWGLPNPSQACPIDEQARIQAIQAERTAFEDFEKQGRLAAIIYYTWSGAPGPKAESYAIFRCGALTDAGKLALSPM